jgi:uncharacterized protein YdeI (YjbR/CyaY-like superfamily)
MSVTSAAPELPVIAFASGQAWEAWLRDEHAHSPGIWLKIAKQASGIATVTYSEALDIALCFGWIDGQKGAADSDFWLQRFTPRTARSKWSKANCTRAESLIVSGRMQPAGQAEVDRAREDGRWDAAYDGSRTATVPEDLQSALNANPAAAAFFAELDRTNRYAVLYRVQDAKRPETRAKRIDNFVTMLAEGRKLHP